MRKAVFVVVLVALMAGSAIAQQNRRQRSDRGYPPDLPGAKVEVYKTIGEVNLNIYIFTPKDHDPAEEKSAIVFFFGGGWTGGSPSQFLQHCQYLASRGMVAMAADYRVRSRHGTKAAQCVADAKSAVRWIRTNADRLGIDPDRVATGGGSAGGHLAACTGTLPGLDEPKEDTSTSCVPNAMVLFNPALVLAQVGDSLPFDSGRTAELQARMGTAPENISPYHHVKKGAPPTIIFHGSGDTTVPFKTAQLFADKMTELGNRCELVSFEGRSHGFFNYGRGDGKDYTATVRAMDEFLTSLGFLKGEASIK